MKEGEKREKEQRAPKGSSASLLLIIISRRVAREFVPNDALFKVSCGVLVSLQRQKYYFS